MEKEDPEIQGVYTAEFWEYDSRSCRRWNTDPVVTYSESPYATFHGNPVYMIDPAGNSADGYVDENNNIVGYDEKGDNGVFHQLSAGTDIASLRNQNGQINSELASKRTTATIFPDVSDQVMPALKDATVNLAMSVVWGLATTALTVDDVLPGAQADDVLIPYTAYKTFRNLQGLMTAVSTLAAVKAIDNSITSVTYTKPNLANPNIVYSGRTRGIGDPNALVRLRDATHHMDLQGFGPAVFDRAANGIEGYSAIRGREQQLIDSWGGSRSDNGRSGNAIRGVAKLNPLGLYFHHMSNVYFGNIAPYTGWYQ